MRFKKLTALFGLSIILAALVLPVAVHAAPAPDAGLALEVSPSPLVLTVKPAESRTVELKIFNAGTVTENLKIALQTFSVDKRNSKVTLEPGVPIEIASWVTFPRPTFSVKPGERTTVQAVIKTPPSAGFSYNFAMVITRQSTPQAVPGQSAVVGSVAVFTLLNIDRPGAVKKLAVDSLTTDHKYYEYLPAKLTLKLRNDGNSLILPGGNAYIQRKATSNNPISVLPVNPGTLYLLPGVTREYPITWNDGLPVYVESQPAVNVTPEKHLEWNWRDSHVRIGRYVARVVIVYNDGTRDVPIEAQVGFWVIPWKILLGLLLALLILLAGVFAILRVPYKAIKRRRNKKHE